jgi:class 3 adenylate cyclase/pimeloyl-ACP methyl ester carboxylesterase
MDAPPIQYAKTSDGVNIAYSAIGQGPPLVILPNPAGTNVQLEWEFEPRRILFERLAERAQVIHYDWRGLGVSQRDCLDLSPEAASRDLESVVQSLGLERFAAYGGTRTQTAFVFAAEHPDRVSHLILEVPPFPPDTGRRLAAIRMHADQDWEMFTEIWARVLMGWDNPSAVQLAAGIRGTTDRPSDYLAALDAIAAFSPEPYLAAIKVPTLILHARDDEQASRIARSLAGGIGGAHLMGITGWSQGFGITETAVTAILDFINTAPAAPGAPIPPPQIDISAVRTIVFTDVEGSTALNERLGDDGARQVLREHERLTREALGAHGGSEVKAMGDGFMAWFPSATRAVECAIALQKALAGRNTTVGAPLGGGVGGAAPGAGAGVQRPEPRSDTPEPIRVRIGINAGEPIAEGDDLFGASVIATARIAAKATGGQILASDVVRQLLAGKGFTFTERGEHALKGFDELVRLYEVRWQESPA